MAVQITKEEFKKLKMKVEEMEEILSILFDRELMESVGRGKRDIERGDVVSLEEYEKIIDKC